MLELKAINCPYCGESFEVHLDLSAGDQQFIEDCYVCCRPIEFAQTVSSEGELTELSAARDDE